MHTCWSETFTPKSVIFNNSGVFWTHVPSLSHHVFVIERSSIWWELSWTASSVENNLLSLLLWSIRVFIRPPFPSFPINPHALWVSYGLKRRFWHMPFGSVPPWSSRILRHFSAHPVLIENRWLQRKAPNNGWISSMTLWWTNILPWKITMLLMGKSTISMAIFNCYVSSPEGKDWWGPRNQFLLGWVSWVPF